MYFIFDLDGTLANVFSDFNFLMNIVMTVRSDEKNYTQFIEKIAELEASDNPLGIIRPGILHVMEKLHSKKARVIIYSNNGLLECLEFIRDIIHAHIGKNIIEECIHLYHPLRSTIPKNTIYDKIWKELQHIIKTICKVDADPASVYFIDDQDHKGLFNVNYIKVPEYKYKVSFNRIAGIYSDITKDTIENIENIIEFTRSADTFMKVDKEINDMSKIIDTLKISGGKYKKYKRKTIKRKCKSRKLKKDYNR